MNPDKTALLNKIKLKEWYHVIEIAPDVKTPGCYDPKPLLDRMGFPKDLSGKTVLDIGSYDGFFAFEAEKRGAKYVLAIDRHPADHCGFALARELLNSKVEYMISSVYDLSPETHGMFDVVFFFGVLYHLKHPLLAIEKIHSVCREYLLLETHVLDNHFIYQNERLELKNINPILQESPILQFYPGNELNNDLSNWFAPNIRCIESMLATSGFTSKLVGQWSDRAAFFAKREEFSPPHWY